MPIITDTVIFKALDVKSVISEAAGGRKVLQTTGIIQIGDELNQNNRIYPTTVLKEAVNEIQERVKARDVKGEWDHPDNSKITLERISHVITKVWMEGKYVYGIAEVIEEMPCGKMMAALLRSKVQFGLSSRGVGEMETVNEGQGEHYIVQPGYTFVTWDAVSSPSVSKAIVTVMEGKNSHSKPRANQLMTRSNRAKYKPVDELARELNKWLKRD